MAARLDAATMETIHDLEAQVDELTARAVSLQASLDATSGELAREQDANAQLASERDYYKSFGIEIATRLLAIQEAITATVQAADLAGYKPVPISYKKDRAKRKAAEQVDAAVVELGKTFGAENRVLDQAPAGNSPP